MLTRHERLNHSPSGRRRSTLSNAGCDGPATPSSGSQNGNAQPSAVDAFPSDYQSAGLDHETSRGLLLAGQDDPIFDYAMLLNSPEMNLDSGSFMIDPMLNQENLPLNELAPPQLAPASPILSPPIPDDSYRDGRSTSIRCGGLC